MNIQDYVVISICVAVYLICMIIKPLLSEYALNKWLPLIAGILGIIFNVWLNAWHFTFDIFLNGLASGISATGLDQLIKQTSGYYEEEDDLEAQEEVDDAEGDE